MMNETERSVRSPLSLAAPALRLQHIFDRLQEGLSGKAITAHEATPHAGTAPDRRQMQFARFESASRLAARSVAESDVRAEALAKISREPSGAWTADPGPLRCPRCHGALHRTGTGFDCDAEGCGASLPIRDGVVVVRDTLTGKNKIAADFYNSKLWPRLQVWDSLFWLLNGGQRRARDVVLRHLPKSAGVRLLDVAIGDGVYTSWLPEDWSIVGVDISAAQLSACQRRNSGRNLRLILGEAEDMPFRDRKFDAVLSNGGFNHFNDPEAALREMVRVAKPGAPIVIADEMPDFLNIGRRLGVPKLDSWIASKLMSMGDDFAGLIESHRNIDIAAIGRRVLKDSHYEVIWRGWGYLMVGYAPEKSVRT